MSFIKKAIIDLPTGFTNLGYLISGLHNSDLMMSAARASTGEKTALGINTLENMAINTKLFYLMFRVEMTSMIAMLMISVFLRVNQQNLCRDHLTNNESKIPSSVDSHPY